MTSLTIPLDAYATGAPHPLGDLHGQVALITHGDHGLGLQAALTLGQAGARLMISGPDAQALELACADLQAAGCDARWVQTSPATDAAPKLLVTEVLHRMGDIDILVNHLASNHDLHLAHSTLPVSPPATPPFAPWRFMALCNAVLEQSMARRGGRIVQLLVLAAAPMSTGTMPEGLLPSTVAALSRKLASHGQTLGVGVNALCATPQADIRGAVLLLASQAGRHITGQCLTIDLGAGLSS